MKNKFDYNIHTKFCKKYCKKKSCSGKELSKIGFEVIACPILKKLLNK